MPRYYWCHRLPACNIDEQAESTVSQIAAMTSYGSVQYLVGDPSDLAAGQG
jgi:hypothetical protein